jgi:hypothetical protein
MEKKVIPELEREIEHLQKIKTTAISQMPNSAWADRP